MQRNHRDHKKTEYHHCVMWIFYEAKHVRLSSLYVQGVHKESISAKNESPAVQIKLK